MMSSSDLPACPACGSREVHPVQKPVADRREAVGRDAPIRHPDDVITATIQTFYACRGCGRDQTDVWKVIQPSPPVVPVLGNAGVSVRPVAAHNPYFAEIENGSKS